MNETITFSESVILLDVAFLNNVIEDLKSNFTRTLGRDLQVIDLSALITYIALDSGFPRESGKQVQVLLIYDNLSAQIRHASPSCLETELHNRAFHSEWGEFAFYAFRPEGFSSRENFFMESAKLLSAAKEIKRLCIIAEPQAYAEELHDTLTQCTPAKEVVWFGMSPPPPGLCLKEELLGYPIMRALGIRADEL